MKKSKKLPAFHFYTGDWKKDIGVQILEPIDRYVWLECLFLMHNSEQRGVLIINGHPMSYDQIARAINLDNQITSKALANIKQHGVCGVRNDEAIFSRRMVRDEEISQIRSKIGSMGGNPNLLNQNTSKSEANKEQNTEDEIEIENRSNKKNGHDLTLSPRLSSPRVLEALSMWVEKLRSQGRELTQMMLDAQIMNLQGDEKRIIAAMIFSSSLTKCLNLVEPSDKKSNNGTHGKDPPKSIPASESNHPAMVAQRRRDAQSAIDNLSKLED